MDQGMPSHGAAAAAVGPTLAALSGTAAVRAPYLVVFGPETGVFDFALKSSTTIGRAADCDLRLTHQTVSRVHATITSSAEQCLLEDTDSAAGVLVNAKRVTRAYLQHGDTIQISMYILQYRTHAAPPGAASAVAQARHLLRSDFALIPSTMRLKYRALGPADDHVFRTGDTLRVGQGGLLIPLPHDLGDAVSLELELRWPSRQVKRYLGEVMGVLEEAGILWACVKLHTVAPDLHTTTVAAAQCGEWIEVPPT
jgi:pSer/pThr/pTyr-binding forkhead associated (FHA) protein